MGEDRHFKLFSQSDSVKAQNCVNSINKKDGYRQRNVCQFLQSA